MIYSCSDRMCGAADCKSCRGSDARDFEEDDEPFLTRAERSAAFLELMEKRRRVQSMMDGNKEMVAMAKICDGGGL